MLAEFQVIDLSFIEYRNLKTFVDSEILEPRRVHYLQNVVQRAYKISLEIIDTL